MNFYKNVIVHRGKLLVRGVLGGKDYQKLDFGLYVCSDTKRTNSIKLYKDKI